MAAIIICRCCRCRCCNGQRRCWQVARKTDNTENLKINPEASHFSHPGTQNQLRPPILPLDYANDNNTNENENERCRSSGDKSNENAQIQLRPRPPVAGTSRCGNSCDKTGPHYPRIQSPEPGAQNPESTTSSQSPALPAAQTRAR